MATVFHVFLNGFCHDGKHGSSAFCAEASFLSVESFGQEATYWTSDTPYFFFTSDYIAPLSFALDEGPETSCPGYMAASERLSGFLYASVDCFYLLAGLYTILMIPDLAGIIISLP